jgi:hypothetical protein
MDKIHNLSSSDFKIMFSKTYVTNIYAHPAKSQATWKVLFLHGPHMSGEQPFEA